MRKTLAAGVAILVTGGATAAGAATGDPPAQRFKIEIVNQTSRALASGAVVNGRGTAAPTVPASFELRFPGAGPANLTVSPATVVRSISAGCLERLSESGTFRFFGFNPPGTTIAFGGDGTFVATSVTRYRRIPDGSCATTAPPLTSHATLDAAATRLVAVA